MDQQYGIKYQLIAQLARIGITFSSCPVEGLHRQRSYSSLLQQSAVSQGTWPELQVDLDEPTSCIVVAPFAFVTRSFESRFSTSS